MCGLNSHLTHSHFHTHTCTHEQVYIDTRLGQSRRSADLVCRFDRCILATAHAQQVSTRALQEVSQSRTLAKVKKFFRIVSALHCAGLNYIGESDEAGGGGGGVGVFGGGCQGVHPKGQRALCAMGSDPFGCADSRRSQSWKVSQCQLWVWVSRQRVSVMPESPDSFYLTLDPWRLGLLTTTGITDSARAAQQSGSSRLTHLDREAVLCVIEPVMAKFSHVYL